MVVSKTSFIHPFETLEIFETAGNYLFSEFFFVPQVAGELFARYIDTLWAGNLGMKSCQYPRVLGFLHPTNKVNQSAKESAKNPVTMLNGPTFFGPAVFCELPDSEPDAHVAGVMGSSFGTRLSGHQRGDSSGILWAFIGWCSAKWGYYFNGNSICRCVVHCPVGNLWDLLGLVLQMPGGVAF